METDPHDALMAIEPPINHRAELERLRLGMFRGGFANKWLWNESEVRRMSKDAARKICEMIRILPAAKVP